MFEFMSGLIAAGFLISGLFFLRFWRRTGDFLFMAFALAFWLLALNQTLLVMSDLPYEERSWIYLLRLAAFTLIIVAIIRKNRRA
ncbi:DUF5985 family protein [Aurantimonas endophytica]|uniref:Putative membrane protein n=1 Tax=Aurantimonas endophytica TaxID=1522175 RepID=A0A7W6HEP7_9HYPH|nr:DUF5985 family protein [Aurantimonas endophytica]MBB4003854.1 putative membrane protein [Aurantimonas endophytica]MCO6404705.1 hypothetical protein [Aurantimonas endophytica]